jgi:NADH-quinone oxidoreductase subunit N
VAYYIWIAKQMYLEEPTIEKPVNDSNRTWAIVPLAVMAAVLIVLGIWLAPVVDASAVYAAKVGF